MGERGYRATLATLLAEAVYAQGRFGQAQQLTEEAEALAGGRRQPRPGPVAGNTGQAARPGTASTPPPPGWPRQAVALIPATADAPERAEFLVAKAEVSQLAGELDEAEDSLRQALQFYERPAGGAACRTDPCPARQPRRPTPNRPL